MVGPGGRAPPCRGSLLLVVAECGVNQSINEATHALLIWASSLVPCTQTSLPSRMANAGVAMTPRRDGLAPAQGGMCVVMVTVLCLLLLQQQ